MHDLWTLPSVSKEREVARSDRMDRLRVPQVAKSPKCGDFEGAGWRDQTTTDTRTTVRTNRLLDPRMRMRTRGNTNTVQ